MIASWYEKKNVFFFSGIDVPIRRLAESIMSSRLPNTAVKEEYEVTDPVITHTHTHLQPFVLLNIGSGTISLFGAPTRLLMGELRVSSLHMCD